MGEARFCQIVSAMLHGARKMEVAEPVHPIVAHFRYGLQ